ncbi:MAG: hypothetical protein HYT12_03690 [Candidatus Liptonbacteria bacterium]|nr:hypothetical protein [Candidatus Liptonbacteria bacterium]
MNSKKVGELVCEALQEINELDNGINMCLEELSKYERDLAKSGFGGEILRKGPEKIRGALYSLKRNTANLRRFFDDGK